MKSVTFYVNDGKREAAVVRDRLAEIAKSLALLVTDEKSDIVIVLGGDGTMLSAVHKFPGVPLLGLNLGTLGYLSGVEAPHFEDALRAVANGDYTVSNRTALCVNGHTALNDIVVSRGVSGHAAVIELVVDDRPATTFFADGLVVATPTGSTAYSLSAGGPILLPDSQSIVITPVCPHALTSRPLVIRDSSKVSIRLNVRPGAESLEIFADGASLGSLVEGKTLTIEKDPVGVPLVELSGYDPYEVLNRKLGWCGNSIK